jgi:hypothetical protein
MRQIYFCPNCRAPIVYGDRFCGNCGVNLKWEITQIPPQSLPLTAKPISNEISKLLADFFNKQAKCISE